MLLRRIVDHFLAIKCIVLGQTLFGTYSGHAIEAKTLINKTMYK